MIFMALLTQITSIPFLLNLPVQTGLFQNIMINKKRNTFLNSVQKKGFACPGHVAGKQFSYGKYFKTQESLICLKKNRKPKLPVS